MSEVPKNRKIDIESVKQELRSEFREEIENYISDIFDETISNFRSSEDDSELDSVDEEEDGENESSDPEPEDPKDFDLSLNFKNNRGKFVSPINSDNGELREFGVVSVPDGQGNVSVKVFAKIEDNLQKKPSYFTINYQLVD